MALAHIALISFYANTPVEVKQKIFGMYQTLAADCGGEEAGILEWKTGWNQDLRTKLGRVWELVEVTRFRDHAALQAFRVHPKHTELTDLLRNHADWVVGDIEVP